MLEIKGVSKSFYKNKVLENVNLNVQKGEIHGLNTGSIYTIVTKSNKKEFVDFLKGLGASLVEETPISLEELFV